MKCKWDMPQGDMIRFDSEDDVKHFFAKLNISPESAGKYGISFRSRQMTDVELEEYGIEYDEDYKEDTEIYICDEKRIPTAPIFDKNKYVDIEKQGVVKGKTPVLVFDKDDIIVDKEYYSSYPCVAFMSLTSGFDRTGSTGTDVYVCYPINDMMTPKTIQDEEDKYIDTWISNTDKIIGYEKRLQKEGLL